MTFAFTALDLVFNNHRPRGGVANFLRGQLGAALHREAAHYARVFDPPRDLAAPSGFRDPLRPFVLRASNPNRFTLHLFDPTIAEIIVEAWKPDSHYIHNHEIDLVPHSLPPGQLEVHFLSPTDIRTETPDFGTLFARARDRVSGVCSSFGSGPLSIDHKALGEAACSVELVESQLTIIKRSRRSAASGQTHPLSGFTGRALYQGDFTDFYPILSAAQFTGVGRKTVWGNGQFEIRILRSGMLGQTAPTAQFPTNLS